MTLTATWLLIVASTYLTSVGIYVHPTEQACEAARAQSTAYYKSKCVRQENK